MRVYRRCGGAWAAMLFGAPRLCIVARNSGGRGARREKGRLCAIVGARASVYSERGRREQTATRAGAVGCVGLRSEWRVTVVRESQEGTKHAPHAPIEPCMPQFSRSRPSHRPQLQPHHHAHSTYIPNRATCATIIDSSANTQLRHSVAPLPGKVWQFGFLLAIYSHIAAR